MSKIRPSGGYRKLASFQTATIIYDATVWFCEKFVDRRSRMVDQDKAMEELIDQCTAIYKISFKPLKNKIHDFSINTSSLKVLDE